MSGKPENKIDLITYEEDKLKYFVAAYDEADKRNKELRDQVIENRKFYEGIDDELEKRKSNPNVKRSALFIPEMRSAIDTRHAMVLDRAEDNVLLTRLKLEEEYADDQDMIDAVRDKEPELMQILQDSGYLWEGQTRQFIGAEIQPISVVKISKVEEKADVPYQKVIKPNPAKQLMHLLKYAKPLPPEVVTEYRYEVVRDDIKVEWLDHDAVLYSRGMDAEDLTYIIHRTWMDWNGLVEFCSGLGVKPKDLEKVKEEGGDEDKSEDLLAEEADVKDKPEVGFKDGKFLVCEFWFEHFNKEMDRMTIRRMIVARNKVVLKDTLSPYRGLKFPFHFKKAWMKLGKFEGTSSVELAKTTQRVYSDLINCMLDVFTYSVLPPVITTSGLSFKEQPVYGPGEFWRVNDINGLKPFDIPVGPVAILPPMIQSMGAKLRQILNAPEIDQGIQDNNSDEKATKTRLRAMGSARRLRDTLKGAADDIKAIAEMIMAIKQQDDPSWVLPVTVEIPALSGVYTPDEELQASMAIFEAAAGSVLYQSPIGKLKLRQLFEDVLEKSRVKGIDSRIITEDELKIEDALIQQIQDILKEQQTIEEQGQITQGEQNAEMA